MIFHYNLEIILYHVRLYKYDLYIYYIIFFILGEGGVLDPIRGGGPRQALKGGPCAQNPGCCVVVG